jgi:hypothetical protein
MSESVTVTPADAKRVWDSQDRPSAVSVARALSETGNPVDSRTINRWRANGWQPDSSASNVDRSSWAATRAAFGCPGEAEDEKLRAELEKLSLEELEKRAYREAFITYILFQDALGNRAEELIINKPRELAKLLDALSSAFVQLMDCYSRSVERQELQRQREEQAKADEQVGAHRFEDTMKEFEAARQKHRTEYAQ